MRLRSKVRCIQERPSSDAFIVLSIPDLRQNFQVDMRNFLCGDKIRSCLLRLMARAHTWCNIRNIQQIKLVDLLPGKIAVHVIDEGLG